MGLCKQNIKFLDLRYYVQYLFDYDIVIYITFLRLTIILKEIYKNVKQKMSKLMPSEYCLKCKFKKTLNLELEINILLGIPAFIGFLSSFEQ